MAATAACALADASDGHGDDDDDSDRTHDSMPALVASDAGISDSEEEDVMEVALAMWSASHKEFTVSTCLFIWRLVHLASERVKRKRRQAAAANAAVDRWTWTVDRWTDVDSVTQ